MTENLNSCRVKSIMNNILKVENLTKKFKYNDIESCENLFNEFPGQIQ